MSKYTCERGGAGWILHEGRKALWETATLKAMYSWLKENGIPRSAVCFMYMRRSILIVR